MIQIGQAVGNYRVVDLLGEGGMGAVYLAEHPVIGRKAALKVIHPQHARNPDVVARFVDEATAINRVGHQHIVEVTDFGRTPAGDFYFIMEYLEGTSLAEAIGREAPFEAARAVKIAAQIADALAASHAHGVIHRDLKPDNIFLVERDGAPDFVKVLDFGLAKLVHEHSPARHQTLRGVVMGTPEYMSPEQCEGHAALDARADVYSLGVVLFQMLTGRLPFGGDDAADVLLKHLTAPPPSIRAIAPALPATLDRVVQRAMAKRADERFASMELFRAALLEPGASTSPTLMAAPAIRAAARRPSNGALDRVPRRTGPRNLVLVALGLVVGAGLTYGRAHRLTSAPTADASTPGRAERPSAAEAEPAVPEAAGAPILTTAAPPPGVGALTDGDDDGDPPVIRRRHAASSAHRGHARPALRQPPPDEDDVLAPSFAQ